MLMEIFMWIQFNHVCLSDCMCMEDADIEDMEAACILLLEFQQETLHDHRDQILVGNIVGGVGLVAECAFTQCSTNESRSYDNDGGCVNRRDPPNAPLLRLCYIT